VKIIDQSVKVFYPRTLEDGIHELQDIESAGRNCWRSEERITEESYKSFIQNLLKRGHESPVEFATIKLDIMTSRDVLAEITRHRLASFAVESQRYVNESKEEGGIKFIRPLFYVPFDPYYDYNRYRNTSYGRNYEASRKWEDAMELAEDAYNKLIGIDMKNQDARKVLPNSTVCRIMMKCNLRELRHIYALRSSPAAYPEMRELMRLLKIEVDKVYPGFLPEEETK
jgi:thymidylate synthase (FAD)